MKHKLFKGLLAASVLLAGLGSGFSAHADEVRARTMKFSFGQPLEHPMGQGAKIFADKVAEKSGGKLKVSLFPNAILGGDNQNLSGARGGTVDITTVVTGGLVGLVKEFMIFDFPFLFDGEQEAYALADGPVGQQLMDKLPERGLVGLGMWDLGFRNITNARRPVNKLEDIQGLKLRALQSPIYLDLFSTLGANPVPLAFPELYGALEVKAVDGQENPLGLILTNKFYEVQNYLTLSRHTYSGMPILFSKKTWDALNDTERGIITEAAREATAAQRELARQQNAEALTALREHMTVSELDEAELARIREKVAPVVDKYRKEVGEDFVQSAYDELARVRAAKN